MNKWMIWGGKNPYFWFNTHVLWISSCHFSSSVHHVLILIMIRLSESVLGMCCHPRHAVVATEASSKGWDGKGSWRKVLSGSFLRCWDIFICTAWDEIHWGSTTMWRCFRLNPPKFLVLMTLVHWNRNNSWKENSNENKHGTFLNHPFEKENHLLSNLHYCVPC